MTYYLKTSTAAQIADLLENGGVPIDQVAALMTRTVELLRELAAAQLAAPVAVQESDRDYTRTFNAIGKAVTVHPGGMLGISVKAFWSAYGAQPAQGERQPEPTTDCRESCGNLGAECDFPLCKSEVEQRRIADQVYRALCSGK